MKIRYYILILLAVFFLFWALISLGAGEFIVGFVSQMFFSGIIFPIILFFLRIFHKKASLKTALWKLLWHFLIIIIPLALIIMWFIMVTDVPPDSTSAYNYDSNWGLFIFIGMWLAIPISVVNWTYFFVKIYRILKKKNP